MLFHFKHPELFNHQRWKLPIVFTIFFFFFRLKKRRKKFGIEWHSLHIFVRLIQDIKFFVANKRDKYSNNNNKNNYVRLLYWNICTKKILEVFTFGMQISTKNKTDWNDLSFYHSLWFQFQIAFQRGFFYQLE